MEIRKIGKSIEHTYTVRNGTWVNEFWPKEILFLMGGGELDEDWIDSLINEGVCEENGELTKAALKIAKFLKDKLVIVDGHIYDSKTLLPFPLNRR